MIKFEGKIHRETSVFRQWRDCYAVLTKDRLLHIFDSEISGKMPDPVASLCLLEAKIMVSTNPDDLYFEVIEKQRGGFFKKITAPRRTMLKAEPSEYLQQWMENIQSLIH